MLASNASSVDTQALTPTHDILSDRSGSGSPSGCFWAGQSTPTDGGCGGGGGGGGGDGDGDCGLLDGSGWFSQHDKQ